MRHLVRSLEAQQTPTCVVTPYAGRFCLQRVANFVANRFMHTHPEASWLWLRRVYVKLLTERLRRLVGRLDPDGPIVFSAQDALSAQVAMQVRDAFAPEASVALTVHFNVSEAQEFVDKGLARRDGALYQALVDTEDRAMTQVDRLIFVSEFSERVCRARNPGLADSQVLANFVPEPDTPEVESTLADAVGDWLAGRQEKPTVSSARDCRVSEPRAPLQFDVSRAGRRPPTADPSGGRAWYTRTSPFSGPRA